MSIGVSVQSNRLPLKIWSDLTVPAFADINGLISGVYERWKLYSSQDIDRGISEHDDMRHESDGTLEEYLRVGVSAVKIVTEAMLLAGRCEFDSVLDLPCGGGRVTRHLRAFFPESKLFVADIDKNKEIFAVNQFNAEPFPFHKDYLGRSELKVDLLFSGSLLTHFDLPMFDRALHYFVEALNPGGLAILTLHGRNCASHALAQHSRIIDLFAKRRMVDRLKQMLFRIKYKTNIDPSVALNKHLMRRGFGYYACPMWTAMYGQSYGGSFTAPSWVINRIESRSDCRILGYKEMSFANYQDVVIVQKI
ncbi:class I SAM-dependent methyltransferase [Methylobacterium pseudosasicola]|uniref:Methyltransferase domain-containing protein n=1 Tax=Methylobacterium pseudosasicola TaxID=582667 RepID=A0A1I4NVE0_9HYPH|nr:class I SAM-dependent methyltransferase [Methylobacterium pseudosasicola]SFM19366.1 Methyltransferase domain-containing protein [Methylobacterium pseudosasicola]